MDPDQLIATIKANFHGIDGRTSLFLAGSYGRGHEDRFSDIDFVAVAESKDHSKLIDSWRHLIGKHAEIVFWQQRQFHGLLVNIITETWLRIDLYVESEAQFLARFSYSLKAVVDPGNLLGKLSTTTPVSTPDKGVVLNAVTEFIRVLGLSPVVTGRGETVTLDTGGELLMSQFSTLMAQANAQQHSGGALHLSQTISPKDFEILQRLTDRSRGIEGHVEIARSFFPYAKQLCRSLDVEWPERFEQITRSHLQRAFGERHTVSW